MDATVDSRGQRRAALVPQLAKLTRSRDFRASLRKAVDAEDNLTVIPVLPDDTMSYVFDRLRESGTRGVVAMQAIESGAHARDVDHWELALAWPATDARVSVAREDDSLAQIHGDSDVSMFFEYLRREQTVVVQEIVARLMPDDDMQTA